ncbi:hypothetical protein DIPPA_06861 [Diplonema papillatum]|nr:hypothetical protein DIPPA_06861 [Diplonema papillatum]|eukprot:gene5308-8099_t
MPPRTFFSKRRVEPDDLSVRFACLQNLGVQGTKCEKRKKQAWPRHGMGLGSPARRETRPAALQASAPVAAQLRQQQQQVLRLYPEDVQQGSLVGGPVRPPPPPPCKLRFVSTARFLDIFKPACPVDEDTFPPFGFNRLADAPAKANRCAVPRVLRSCRYGSADALVHVDWPSSQHRSPGTQLVQSRRAPQQRRPDAQSCGTTQLHFAPLLPSLQQLMNTLGAPDCPQEA